MLIEIKGLKKSFGDLKVFDGLDLTIQAGEICIIMGRSGQGKSVLLKHLVGLIKPDAGQILIDGQDIVPMKERELYPIRRRFGMIFQGGGMLQSLSVGENVGLPLIETTNESKQEIQKRVAEKLKLVGLEGREDQNVATLSGGQKKRVAIARALVQGSDCLLYDEPTAGLDPPISKTVDDIILRMDKETNATQIVVTHDLVSAFTVGEKLHLIEGGKVIASGTPDEIKSSKNEKVQEFLARGLTI